MMPFGLPSELVVMVVENMKTLRDINAFARTNLKLYDLLNSYLYHHDAQNFKSSALLWAAEHGNLATAQLSQKAGADVNIAVDKGTPLTLATRGGHLAVIEVLLKNGANPDSEHNFMHQSWEIGTWDEYYLPVLSWAAKGGHHDLIKLLIENGAKLNTRDTSTFGRTPLIHATFQRSLATVWLLLDYGAEPDYQDSWGWTPLFYAAQCRWRAEAVAQAKLLLKYGANVDFKDGDGRTPLFVAVVAGSPEMVRVLGEYGADPAKAQKSNGKTPPFNAGNAEMVLSLVEIGADLNWTDEDGRTALSIAVSHLAELHEERIEVIRALLRMGAKPNLEDRRGRTALIYAVDFPAVAPTFEGAREQVARLLLDHGADPNSKDHTGTTSLFLAAKEGHTGIAQSLLEKDAYPNSKNNDGQTPLNAAVKRGYRELLRSSEIRWTTNPRPSGILRLQTLLPKTRAMIELLVKYGADPADCAEDVDNELLEFLNSVRLAREIK